MRQEDVLSSSCKKEVRIPQKIHVPSHAKKWTIKKSSDITGTEQENGSTTPATVDESASTSHEPSDVERDTPLDESATASLGTSDHDSGTDDSEFDVDSDHESLVSSGAD